MKKIFYNSALILFTVSNVYSQSGKDNFIIVVKSQADWVILGDKYAAEIYLAKPIPPNTEVKTTVQPGTNAKIEKEQDKFIYTATAANEGLQTFSGNVNIKNSAGKIESLPFETSVVVAKRTASIRTNYLIKGIENPLEVSVMGIPPFNLKVESSNGSVSVGGQGAFKITPAMIGKCTITVKANIDGSIKIIETFDYEVVEIK